MDLGDLGKVSSVPAAPWLACWRRLERAGAGRKTAARRGPMVLCLPLRRVHRQPVKVVAHLDLARQPRIGLNLVGEIQHILFHRRRFANLLAPGFLDIDVTGRAGARAAAFRLDPRHAIFDRGLHHGRADFALDRASRAGLIDECDFDHGRKTNPEETGGKLAADTPSKSTGGPQAAAVYLSAPAA